MKSYWVKTHAIIKRLFYDYVWDIPNNEKTVYLTFDDGPTPEITEWVLSQLDTYAVKATFFCIGYNIKSNPKIFQRLINEGHHIGNHTYEHPNGWDAETIAYLKNVKDCENEIREHGIQNQLFRPPYGKLKPSQSKALRKMGYKIIMWDILSGDFDKTITREKCLGNVVKNLSSGSIVIFHDSKKAFENLEYALPETLKFLKTNGYKCGLLD